MPHAWFRGVGSQHIPPWVRVPAPGTPRPPPGTSVSAVGTLVTELSLSQQPGWAVSPRGSVQNTGSSLRDGLDIVTTTSRVTLCKSLSFSESVSPSAKWVML